MSERRFPLLGTGRTISWGTAELAYAEYYRKYGGDQSLERLAERGGFGEGEMDSLYPDWRKREDKVLILETTLDEVRTWRDLPLNERLFGDLNYILRRDR